MNFPTSKITDAWADPGSARSFLRKKHRAALSFATFAMVAAFGLSGCESTGDPRYGRSYGGTGGRYASGSYGSGYGGYGRGYGDYGSTYGSYGHGYRGYGYGGYGSGIFIGGSRYGGGYGIQHSIGRSFGGGGFGGRSHGGSRGGFGGSSHGGGGMGGGRH